MKILIDKNGWLHIERAGEMKRQYCLNGCKDDNDYIRECGDWCPAFGEPGPGCCDAKGKPLTVIISLCSEADRLICEFEHFTDERRERENENTD